MMFQEPRLLPWRTVGRISSWWRLPSFTEDDLERLAQAVGIADMLPRYPQELSLGLARRVALARAFATKPDLLLLDEPFVSLDERTADRLRKLLLDVWQQRPTTAILVTHNAREAIMLADQLVLLAPRPDPRRRGRDHQSAASRARSRRGRGDPHRSLAPLSRQFLQQLACRRGRSDLALLDAEGRVIGPHRQRQEQAACTRRPCRAPVQLTSR